MVGRVLREQAEILLEPLPDFFRIILHCRGMIRCIPAFDAEHDIGPSPKVSPPLTLGGCKGPNGLAVPKIADWYRKSTPTISTGEGN
jgi:hypothetical protein